MDKNYTNDDDDYVNDVDDEVYIFLDLWINICCNVHVKMLWSQMHICKSTTYVSDGESQIAHFGQTQYDFIVLQ